MPRPFPFCFQMLQEVGFLAGQHEILADSFTKEHYKSIQEQVKRLKEGRKKNIKESEKIASELKSSYKTMDSAKEKFRKAFDEQERTAVAYNRANDDGSVTKNEVSKLKLQATQKAQQCETAKTKYASQLVKTNDFQHKYYTTLLPRVLEGLQGLEKQRIEVIRSSIMSCVTKEKEVLPIMGKCYEAIEKGMRSVNPETDANIVIERFKSGDVPPGDFKFEDMSDPHSMLSNDPTEKATNLNLYPRKRELERMIEQAESDLGKKQKELAALQQMVETYKSNPKFGNSKKFQEEISNLNKVVTEIENALHAMRTDHAAIENQLESLKRRSPMPAGSPMLLNRDRTPRSSQSSGSLKSSSLSIGSNAMNTSPDSSEVYERVGMNREPVYADDEWEDVPPPPPPMPRPTSTVNHTANNGVPRAVAIYSYSGDKLQVENTPFYVIKFGTKMFANTFKSNVKRFVRLRNSFCF